VSNHRRYPQPAAFHGRQYFPAGLIERIRQTPVKSNKKFLARTNDTEYTLSSVNGIGGKAPNSERPALISPQ
jgi:hypothetical protein